MATQPVGGGAAALAAERLQQEAEGLRVELAARQRRQRAETQLEPEAAPHPAPHPAPQPALQPVAANGFGTFTDGFFGEPKGAARQRELEAVARVERLETLKRRGEACIQARPGRHCHSTRSLSVIDCHSLGIYTVILLPLLSFFVEMTVSRHRPGIWPARGWPSRRWRSGSVALSLIRS